MFVEWIIVRMSLVLLLLLACHPIPSQSQSEQTPTYPYTSGLKLGRVILIIQVTFCPGEFSLIWFIKYPDLTPFYIKLHALLITSGPDQSEELGMLDSDDVSISPPKKVIKTAVLEKVTVQLEYFDCLVQSCTCQMYIHSHQLF